MLTINQIFNPVEARLQLYLSNRFLRYEPVSIDTLFESIDSHIYSLVKADAETKIELMLSLISKIDLLGKSVVSKVTTDWLHDMQDLDEYYRYQDEVAVQINHEVKLIRARLLEFMKVIKEEGFASSRQENLFLQKKLQEFGFWDLPKVRAVKNPKALLEYIHVNQMPGALAWLYFLDFIKHLQKYHFETQKGMIEEMSKWFNSDVGGRTIKGHLSSLVKNPDPKSNVRYTAYQYTEQIENLYQSLK